MRCTREGCHGTCYEEGGELICWSCGQHYAMALSSTRPSDTAITFEITEASTMVYAEDLPHEVQERLGVSNEDPPDKPKRGKYKLHNVSPEVPALGRILRALEGLTNKQARWCLNMATEHLRLGSRRSANVGVKRGSKAKQTG